MKTAINLSLLLLTFITTDPMYNDHTGRGKGKTDQ